MNIDLLIEQIKTKRSFLCVGLDTDLQKIPPHLLKEEDPIFAFNKQIIDATAPYCVAYKPNLAFYEAYGSQSMRALEKTLDYIPKDCYTIADAKRGDIGNTASMYAKAFFEQMNFDSLTVAPYMGEDSVKPFIGYKDKAVILLALTSNSGSADFQQLTTENGQKVFEQVLTKAKQWASWRELMFVVGATQANYLTQIRKIVPEHFLLVPGVGAQGGDLQEVAKYGMNKNVGLLVNASRSIIYASHQEDFAVMAAKQARMMQVEMEILLDKYLI